MSITECTLLQVATLIRDAWKQGRNIVPVLGAGASADAGVPPIRSLVEYLAHLQVFLVRTPHCRRDDARTHHEAVTRLVDS